MRKIGVGVLCLWVFLFGTAGGAAVFDNEYGDEVPFHAEELVGTLLSNIRGIVLTDFRKEREIKLTGRMFSEKDAPAETLTLYKSPESVALVYEFVNDKGQRVYFVMDYATTDLEGLSVGLLKPGMSAEEIDTAFGGHAEVKEEVRSYRYDFEGESIYFQARFSEDKARVLEYFSFSGVLDFDDMGKVSEINAVFDGLRESL